MFIYGNDIDVDLYFFVADLSSRQSVANQRSTPEGTKVKYLYSNAVIRFFTAFRMTSTLEHRIVIPTERSDEGSQAMRIQRSFTSVQDDKFAYRIIFGLLYCYFIHSLFITSAAFMRLTLYIFFPMVASVTNDTMSIATNM